MADLVMKKNAEVDNEPAPIHKIRITMTSTKVEALEKVCAELKNKAKGTFIYLVID